MRRILPTALAALLAIGCAPALADGDRFEPTDEGFQDFPLDFHASQRDCLDAAARAFAGFAAGNAMGGATERDGIFVEVSDLGREGIDAVILCTPFTLEGAYPEGSAASTLLVYSPDGIARGEANEIGAQVRDAYLSGSASQ